MVDPHADPLPNGSPGAGQVEVEAVGAQMSQHFTELIEVWTQQMTSLAELGVDPTPLVLALARTLRSAADQLDPGGTPSR